MKATFTTEEPQEILRLAKSTNMAYFIWELVHNGWRDFKHTDYDYEPAWEKIHELLKDHGLDADELM
jgi:hypothetical protein